MSDKRLNVSLDTTNNMHFDGSAAPVVSREAVNAHCDTAVNRHDVLLGHFQALRALLGGGITQPLFDAADRIDTGTQQLFDDLADLLSEVERLNAQAERDQEAAEKRDDTHRQLVDELEQILDLSTMRDNWARLDYTRRRTTPEPNLRAAAENAQSERVRLWKLAQESTNQRDVQDEAMAAERAVWHKWASSRTSPAGLRALIRRASNAYKAAAISR